MNAHTQRLLTEAETGLIGAFEASGSEDASRLAAIEALRSNGLPTRKVEAYHYTDLRALMGSGYTVCDRPNADLALHAMTDYERLLPTVRLPVVNGHYFADLAGELPQGVSVVPGAASLGSPGDTLANTTALLNTAFATDGVNITVAAGTDVSQLMTIANSFVGETGSIAATKNSVAVESGAKASIVERFCGKDDVSYLDLPRLAITIADEAELNYVLSIEEGTLAQRLGLMDVSLGKNATLNLFVLNAGGKLARQEINFEVVGEGAELNIRGINLIGGESHIDVTSCITHNVPNTNATETFRNVATGKGRGVFQGQIKVAQPAQLTDARMACNTLLLSDECDFSAKPELEIFADDVQCAHGATVADLEDSYLFYLRARGIPEERARRLLVKAFVAEIVDELEDETIGEALNGVIDQWLDRNV